MRGGSAAKFVDLRLKEITMARFRHEEICRGHGCPCEVFSLVLPSILLKVALELYCRSESLFFVLALSHKKNVKIAESLTGEKVFVIQ